MGTTVIVGQNAPVVVVGAPALPALGSMALASIGDYLTAAQSNTLFEAAGAALAAQAAAVAIAAAALSAHVNAGDPHPQYLTAAEGAAAFDASGAAAAAQAASQPAAANLTSWAALAPSAKQDASANLAAWSALTASAKQDQSANLDAWSAIATSTKQATHANLTTLAGLASITPLTRLAASGETVTTSSPLLDLAQTWNGAGVTFTGLKFNVTDTASASASLLLDLQVGGSSRFVVRKDGKLTLSGSLAINAGTLALGSSGDLLLERDAANIFAQRNGTSAQAFRLYNTYTDASNYERLNIGWSANLLTIGTANAGTGVARSIRLDANSYLYLATGGVDRFYLHATAGHILPNIDNTYDLGQASTLRLRTGYFGTALNVGSSSWTGGTLNLGSGIGLPAAGMLGWAATGDPSTTKDLILRRGAAGTLDLHNGANAQAFRLYNTYTDASNYERASFYWSSNAARIVTEAAGTGTVRSLSFGAGAIQWYINSSGHWLANTDNTYDIGSSGATRPRNLYLGGNATIAGSLNSADFRTPGKGFLYFASDGVLSLYNNGQTDFSRLQFGGTTSSFPALKRNATQLQARLADDSAFAPFACDRLTLTDGITAPGSSTGQAKIYVDSADGDLKIIFGDGTVKTIVTD